MARKILRTGLGICIFVGLALISLHRQWLHRPIAPHDPIRPHRPLDIPPPEIPPPELAEELPPPTETSHPISQLIAKAEKEHGEVLARQSDTLGKAVQEYRRRYQLPPPPNFDIWYEFAKARNVQLIDEFDTIYHSLLPFWGLSPAVIRARARESLGSDNNLLGVIIRDGRIIAAAGGAEWQQKSTVGMMDRFVQFLPAMDLPFNLHDEPRVVLPHDDLSRLVALAQSKSLPAAFGREAPKNAFSSPPGDLGDGTRPYEAEIKRFNRYPHQQTWTQSRLSCPPDTPARALDDNIDDIASTFSYSPLGLIFNKTAFSNICLSPSLRERYGFFVRANAFNIVHDLFPVFSQSKVSSYQDILYPSPWYWSNKVAYNGSTDYNWDKKENKLYWRGSTTGGFSRDGGWRRQHRQRFVGKINARDNTKVMENRNTKNFSEWIINEAPRINYKDLMDVKFSNVGQCDQGDCEAQREYFEVVDPAGQDDAWRYKYLLDIDGNAFSGRFYAFLKSMSLVFKMAIFREWHEEWLKPWVHYIPLGLTGDEYVESVRYFSREEEGKVRAPRLAYQSRQWAGKVLRNHDMEVWFFRLLLE
ncbi:MAG: hypothetical protein Q9163_004126 [Psora crenata]